MIIGLYSIRDNRVGYLNVTCDQNDRSAIRNFEHAVMRQEGIMYSHAEDFDLIKLGEYDTDSGVITPMDPMPLLAGLAVKLKYERSESNA